MRNRFVSFVSISVLTVVLLAACGSGDGGDEEDVTRVTVPDAPIAAASPVGGDSPAASPEAPAVADGGGGGAPATFTVDMVDINYVPKELTIPANTEVTINLPNKGAAVHNFVIDELNVKSEDEPGGGQTSVTFSAPAGEYQFYCSQPGHKEAGMVGTLIVTEQAVPPPAAAGEQPAAASPQGQAPAASPPDQAQQAPPAAAAPITVDMVDINYAPKEIRIPADTEVTINLPNKGAALHNFVIDELNVKSEDEPGGGQTSVTFSAPAGEYQYYCSQPGHKEAGMVGTLIVE